jgi:hypothetical protein
VEVLSDATGAIDIANEAGSASAETVYDTDGAAELELGGRA